jgi:hypothetical protein
MKTYRNIVDAASEKPGLARRGASLDLFEVMRGTDVVDIAPRLGLTADPRGIRPCPSCGAERRGNSNPDRRPPIGLTRDGQGWRCHRCGAGGDALALMAIVLTGTTNPDRAGWMMVRRALEAGGLLEPGRQSGRPAATDRPSRPPRGQIGDLWNRGGPVHEWRVAEWLRARGIDPWIVADRDLARTLPDGRLPNWACMGGADWRQSLHLCLLPMYDHHGELESVHARSIQPETTRKGVFPLGHQVGGLVMADDAARLMLASGELAGPLWIVEGAPDFLTLASAWGDAADPAPAVIAIVSGSWTMEMANRVPDGTQVIIAVHQDDAGEKYTEKITNTLAGRVSLERWIPQEVAA